MTSLQALAERLEKATGPGDPCIRGTDFHDALARELFGFRFTVEDAGQVRDAFASLDAAIALCARVLPGRAITIDLHYDGSASATIYTIGVGEGVSHAVAPIALVLAIVRARIAEEAE